MNLAYPISYPVEYWQWTGQPFIEWPNWAQARCTRTGDADNSLNHNSRSGRQRLYMNEYLVKSLDSRYAEYHTEEEFKKKFEVRKPCPIG